MTDAIPSAATSEIRRLEDFDDAVPRASCDVEEHGPFTLFVARSGWPYYARPRRGSSSALGPDDVRVVLARQHELGVPQTFEWVDQVSPQVTAAVPALGLAVERLPLLVLRGEPVGSPDRTGRGRGARPGRRGAGRHGARRSARASRGRPDWMGAVWAKDEEQVGPVGSHSPVAGVAEMGEWRSSRRTGGAAWPHSSPMSSLDMRSPSTSPRSSARPSQLPWRGSTRVSASAVLPPPPCRLIGLDLRPLEPSCWSWWTEPARTFRLAEEVGRRGQEWAVDSVPASAGSAATMRRCTDGIVA